MTPFVRDLAERVLSAYVTTFVGLMAVSSSLNLDALKVAAIASVPAALSILKGALASRVGNPDSASLDPRV